MKNSTDTKSQLNIIFQINEFPYLSKAPIVEALIDFRVSQRKVFDAKTLEAIHEKIKNNYPRIQPLRQLTAGLELKDGGALRQSVEQTETGYRMESADGLYVFQARIDRFTLSRLKPYETWQKLVQETRRAWEIYTEIARTERILRTATRFINRVEIPLPKIFVSDYFTAPPAVPSGLPETMNEFFSRVVVNDPDTGGTLIFTQALEQTGVNGNTLSFIIDIDIFKEHTFNVDSDDYWQLLEKFRDIKNQAFFASITQETINLLK